MTTTTLITMLLLLVCVSMNALNLAQARSTQGYGHMDKLLQSLRGNGDPTTPIDNMAHSLEKRQVYDTSCKGMYDRGLFSDLEHVCDDCYNLYRNPHVATACRGNCYSNLVFRQCMEDLLLMEEFDKYARAIQTVGKKK
uniref:Hyperglycemic hormone n=3 Tax=Chionoecetes TaxID=41209 RepID=A0A096XHP1_CHIOP|nr:hyperglycemic hormone [Chionoecetes japonicus]AHM93480.1 hyperglycemic hormone [Chionoecetes opilio]